MSPAPINISVKAVPIGDQYLVDCSDCGAVGVVPAAETDEACLLHLEVHQVDTGPFRKAQEEQ